MLMLRNNDKEQCDNLQYMEHHSFDLFCRLGVVGFPHNFPVCWKKQSAPTSSGERLHVCTQPERAIGENGGAAHIEGSPVRFLVVHSEYVHRNPPLSHESGQSGIRYKPDDPVDDLEKKTLGYPPRYRYLSCQPQHFPRISHFNTKY